MAFMFVGPDNTSIDWNMVGYERIINNTLLKAEVFRRMPGIYCTDPGFILLPIAAGVTY